MYAWIILSALLVIFSVYFLINEMKQLIKDKLAYFGQIWNYLDIIPPIGVIWIVVTSYILIFSYEAPTEKVVDDKGEEIIQHPFTFVGIDAERTIIAITTIFMWLKILYFMRIFRETGYLIRMIIVVIYDMRIFMFVLFFTLAAFGDAFSSIAVINHGDT